LKPDDKYAFQRLGEAYVILGKKAEAVQVYNALLKLDKDAAKSLLDEINGSVGAASVLVGKAEVQLLGGDQETGLEYLRYALRLKPTDPDAFLEIGSGFQIYEHYDEALELYRRVIAMKPKPETLAEAYSSIGGTYNDKKEYAKALPELKEAQRIKADYYTSKKLGDAYFGLKDYFNALAAFQDSVRLKPDFADGHFWIGKTCVELKQLDKAIVAFQEFVRLEPKCSDGFYELGHTYFLMRRLPDAVSALNQAVSLYPKHAEAHLGLGMSYLAMGKRDAALQEYNTLQSLDKTKAQQLYNVINRPGGNPPPERRGTAPARVPVTGQTPQPPGRE
jgi:tetratricopeptide (TPR) repeat protein